MADRSVIRFPCKCGHWIEVSIEEAGDAVQCPKCGLLRDIPSASDLDNIAGDGTVRMQPKVEQEDPDRLRKLTRAFGRETVDADGAEKDLRLSFEEAQRAGVEPIPFSDEETYKQIGPKYDPETGELIEPIGVSDGPGGPSQPAPEEIPFATRALSYATGEQAIQMTLWRVLVELCQPPNMIVMLFLLVLHVMAQATAYALLSGMFMFAIGKIILLMVILSHYANTVEDIGPENHDDLPRPLRSVSLGEDFWWPFVHFTIALVICYAPAFLAWVYSRGELTTRLVQTGLVAFVGSIPFPAILLTLIASGAPENLRPDRVLRVIKAAGRRYAIALITWYFVLAAYVLCTSGLLIQMLQLVRPTGSGVPWMGRWATAYPMLFLAIFLMHFFCWQVGLIYRNCQPAFGWVHQRHVSKREAEEIKRARKFRGAKRLQRDAAVARALRPPNRK